MSIKISHNWGFFSCCSVKLHHIVEYINLHHTLPIHVDSSELFGWYKVNNNDITFEYFEHPNNLNKLDYKINHNINYFEHYQYHDYRYLDYKNLTNVIHKYFTPSVQIKDIIQKIETKYDLNYDNICVLFYRGNDKMSETQLCDYEDYIKYANKIIEENLNVKFLIQSDETEFIEFITKKIPNSFYFNNEIRHMNRCNRTVDHVMNQNIDIYSKNYLAITIIMSKCKYIICGSGNCSIWIMLYRGNCNNVYQNLNCNWFIN